MLWVKLLVTFMLTPNICLLQAQGCKPEILEGNSGVPEDGGHVFLECDISSCDNVTKIIYEKKGVQGELTREYEWNVDATRGESAVEHRYYYSHFGTKHTLNIKPLILDDKGKWRCIIFDGRNTKYESGSVDVNIYDHAVVSEPQNDVDIEVHAESTFTLNCTGTGYKPTITWQQNGEDIHSNNINYIIEQNCSETKCEGFLTSHPMEPLPTCVIENVNTIVYTCVISLQPPYHSTQTSPNMTVQVLYENSYYCKGTIGHKMKIIVGVIGSFFIAAVIVISILFKAFRERKRNRSEQMDATGVNEPLVTGVGEDLNNDDTINETRPRYDECDRFIDQKDDTAIEMTPVPDDISLSMDNNASNISDTNEPINKSLHRNDEKVNNKDPKKIYNIRNSFPLCPSSRPVPESTQASIKIEPDVKTGCDFCEFRWKYSGMTAYFTIEMMQVLPDIDKKNDFKPYDSQIGGNVEQYRVTHLDVGTEYKIRLKAAAGEYAYIDVCTKDNPVAEKPSALSIGKLSETCIEIRWTRAGNHSSKEQFENYFTYIIEISEKKSNSFTECGKVDGRTFQYRIENLRPGTKYNIRVKEVGKADKSPWSEILEACTTEAEPTDYEFKEGDIIQTLDCYTNKRKDDLPFEKGEIFIIERTPSNDRWLYVQNKRSKKKGSVPKWEEGNDENPIRRWLICLHVANESVTKTD